MRVVRQPNEEARPIVLRLRLNTIKKLDAMAEKVDVSRQRLLEALIERVLADKNFTLRLDD